MNVFAFISTECCAKRMSDGLSGWAGCDLAKDWERSTEISTAGAKLNRWAKNRNHPHAAAPTRKDLNQMRNS